MLRTICLVIATSGMLLMSSAVVYGAELHAGVARVDLTPPLSMKAPLGGYGERLNRPATGVHDRIFAKALVVSDGRKKIAIVTADMLGFPPPFKQAVLDELDDPSWTHERLMLLPSHSHTSIEMNAINPLNVFQIPQIGIHDPKLFEFTVANFAQAIRAAEAKLVPVTIGTTSTQTQGYNRNRRARRGKVDPELTLTRIDQADGRALAVLVNFTAHPTFMSGEDMWFSGGWPGHLQRTLESLIRQDVTVMYYNGAEGDQSPIARPGSGESHWERAEAFGRDLAVIAFRQWRTITPRPNVIFQTVRQTITLPQRAWHPNFKETGGKEYGLTEEVLKEMLPKMFPTTSASVAVRLGDLVIVGVPGELAVELGLEIKKDTELITGAKYPVIGGLADEWVSYILSAEEYDRGGYEASVSFYGRDLGRQVVDAALQGVRRLQ
ncbi:Neutral/alkaline non-lysosomal ceramidase [Symmachiella macrocystis]|uniref:Neutral ceramidase n=1 Tax=Symmachiella macrocystis TaxID=2527985 RepID=A0A5C6BQJ8_9PLAN|nr:neutral/alkaline non-lysosomal ceramidase N-terminal domain-containing protein [Symmachiella macrocystis]TWU13972.1 Neutral/alkaline non-lysosomal ceramidase [Symmachiella macrocystis]